MLKDNFLNYGLISKILHWLIALLIILIFTIGYIMTNMPKSAARLSLYDFHKATGLAILSLVCIRIVWRLINTRPKLTSQLSRQMILTAQYNFYLLYLLMLGLPLSGFLISMWGGYRVSMYSLFTIQPFTVNKELSHLFSTIHQLLVYALIFAFSLHICGALYHRYIIKDNVFQRMWFHSK